MSAVPGAVVNVVGEDLMDAMNRSITLQYFQDNLSTKELSQLKEMSSVRGRKALKTKWSLIKKFI